MTPMPGLLTITHLTLKETVRRRVLLAALVCGLAFLVLFSLGFRMIQHENHGQGAMQVIERHMFLSFVTLAGLYAVNFLTLMTAALVPVDTLSGEIGSGVMQTLASKPIRRTEILLGKWLGHWIVVVGYFAFMAGGVLLVTRWLGGFTPPNLRLGLPLMLLEATIFLTLSIAGGTRFSTVTNAVTVVGLYGLAFIGSWMEQIGTMASNDAARYVGTVASLIIPSEAMWQLAAHHMQPPIMRDLGVTPFSPVSVPSGAMVAWAGGYIVVVLLAAVRTFRRRPL